MRSESPEKRGQQKVAEPPSYRIENEYNPEAIPQYFQISVSVLEGRNFTWINPRSANSYVVVMLGKKKYRTSVRRNKLEPHYKEHFAFGMYANVYELQSTSLSLTVMEPRCCAPPHLLGEANIDLGTVWKQPYYQAFRKWVQLSIPREPTAGSMGSLKVDVTVTGRGGIRIMPPVSRENIFDVNYLLSSGSEQQRANFIITIHGAFGLPNTSRHQSEKHHCAKPPNTFVRVQFCGLHAKTAVQNHTNNPVYNEQMSMVEMFPCSNPTLRFDVCSTDSYASSRLLATTSFNLNYISYDGENGFLPTFGPSLLTMYGSSSTGNFTSIDDCPFYRGSLLITFNTIVPYYHQNIGSVSVEPVVPLYLKNLWTIKNLRIFCPIFEVSMLDGRSVSDFGGVAITIGEMPAEKVTDEDFANVMCEVKTRKLHYTGSLDVQRNKSEFGYLDFYNTYPILQSTTRLPDYRFRMYRNNFINKIKQALKLGLIGVERRLKNKDYSSTQVLLDELHSVLDNVAYNILRFIESNSNDANGNFKQRNETQLDKKQHILQMEEMKRIREKILQRLTLNNSESTNQGNNVRTKYGDTATRRDVKCLLTEAHSLARQLDKLIFKTTEGWPHIVIWLLNDGSRIGFYKIPIADIIYSNISEECGKLCGRIQTIFFKPLKCSKHVSSLSMGCFCVVGKVEFLAWMGLHEHSSSFEHCLPAGYKIKMKDEMYVKCNGILIECRIFIYKACLYQNNTCDNLGHVFLRINTLNMTQDTKTEVQSCTPVWNQILRSQKTMYTSLERLVKYPPVVLVDMNSTDLLGRTEFIGRFQMDSQVDIGAANNNIPKFQWYSMYKGMEKTGQVLMSVQILQIPETVLKTTLYTPLKETFTATELKADAGHCYSNVEPFPSDLIPRASTYKLDVYWWGLRNVTMTKKPYVVLEIEDLAIKSPVIIDNKSNCNFPNGRDSQIFEASFSDVFCPSIKMKLYDNCTFGRTLHLGTSVVKKPNKYFTNWYSKTERNTLLKRASIQSDDFTKVSQTLCVKNKNSVDGSDDYRYNSALNTSLTNISMKRSIWRRLFHRKEPDEEEFTLLPTFTKTFKNNNIKKYPKIDKNDWWTRYKHSLKNYSNAENTRTGDTFIIYDTELEAQMQFSKFKDWCSVVKIYNGEKTGIPEKDEELQCGILKAGIAIYEWPSTTDIVAVSTNGVDLNRGFFDDHPSNEPAKFLVRVYVIEGINLKKKNISGKFQPYVMINSGNIQLGDRNSAVPNTCNPIFGTLYELKCDLPEEYQLTISLYNHDTIEPDELIGSTHIDLENRIYSKHRARVGLASEYNLCGPGKWRDCIKPSAILTEICAQNHLPQPSFPSISTVLVNGVEYKNNEQSKVVASALECRENICLSVLRDWASFPICGYPLVPEHVETRTIYHPQLPGIEQGKLHLWIDIFPIDFGFNIPLPVDITPRKTEEYELKLTIFNVKLFKGKINNNLSKTPTLYIRAWTGFMDNMQNTNCRSISANGYFNFNWDMIFNFNYDFAERKLIKKDRNHIKDFQESVSPELVIQLMDSDTSTFEEPIGWLAFNLNQMPVGGKYSERTLNTIADTKKIDLFSVSSIHAWWLLKRNIEDLDKNAVGCIELQVTLLPKQQDTIMPLQLDRDLPSSSPNQRLPMKTSKNNFSLRNFFYKYNALWGTLTGISVIILIIIGFLYIRFGLLCDSGNYSHLF